MASWIRAKKAQYYRDRRFTARLLPPPAPVPLDPQNRPADDWTGLEPVAAPTPPPTAETEAGKEQAGNETAASNGEQNKAGKEGAASPRADPASGKAASASEKDDDPANAGLRREPGLPDQEDIAPEKPVAPGQEFRFDEDGAQDEAARNRRLQERMTGAARNASLDPDDWIAL